jgi:hypothetical protein
MKYFDKYVCGLWRNLFVVGYILLHYSYTRMLNFHKFKAIYSTDMSYVSNLTKKDE